MTAAMNSARPPLSPISRHNQQQPSSSPLPTIRTYSRKRKLFLASDDNNTTKFVTLHPPLTRSTPSTKSTNRPKTKKQKPSQTSVSAFFNLPTPPTSSPLTPASAAEPGTKSSPPRKVLTQLHLSNLGPSTRTTIHCKICQMHYNKIDPHDQKLHKQHHNSILHGPSFPCKLNTQHTLATPLPGSPIPVGGDLLVISVSSGKDIQKRALGVLSIIDTALGAPPNPTRRTTFFSSGGKIYLLLSREGRVISCVAAERIDFAFRRIPDVSGSGGVETSGEKERCLIGISRMWTCIAERGKGWCSALVEECAAGFVLGVDCRCRRGLLVGFSTPSESGMGFARKWTGREDFLVYDD